MRRIVATIAATTLVLGLATVMPAQASHCSTPDCNVGVSILEGIGFVCDQARPPSPSGIPGMRSDCVYGQDAAWTGPPIPPGGQGLYWPGVGPPGTGPFSFKAGPTSSPPTSLCVSSQGGAGCTFDSWGMLTPGEPSGLGPYCGSSKGTGRSIFTAGDGSVRLVADFGWEQSAATILPLNGTVIESSGTGAPNNSQHGANVTGFTSSRGTAQGGNCGITQATTAFNVEGMVITF